MKNIIKTIVKTNKFKYQVFEKINKTDKQAKREREIRLKLLKSGNMGISPMTILWQQIGKLKGNGQMSRKIQSTKVRVKNNLNITI